MAVAWEGTERPEDYERKTVAKHRSDGLPKTNPWALWALIVTFCALVSLMTPAPDSVKLISFLTAVVLIWCSVDWHLARFIEREKRQMRRLTAEAERQLKQSDASAD